MNDRARVDEIRFRLADPREVASLFGDDWKPHGTGAYILCPFHAERTPSLSLTRAPDGSLRFRCFGCGVGGDVFHLIAARYGLDARRDFLKVLEEAGRLAGVDLTDPTPPPPRRPPPPAPARDYPPDVLRFWDACTGVRHVPAVVAWLRSRGLEAGAVERLDLARAIGPALPEWARYGASETAPSWAETGHVLALPLVDEKGMLRTVRASRVVRAETPKRLPPQGHKAGGVVLANGPARVMLRGARPQLVVVVEGEPDFLTWATARPELPILGVFSGAWTPAIAARIPDGAQVVLRVHHDAAGDGYAATVARTLAHRCEVLRSARAGGDENDLLRAGKLPADPREGACAYR